MVVGTSPIAGAHGSSLRVPKYIMWYPDTAGADGFEEPSTGTTTGTPPPAPAKNVKVGESLYGNGNTTALKVKLDPTDNRIKSTATGLSVKIKTGTVPDIDNKKTEEMLWSGEALDTAFYNRIINGTITVHNTTKFKYGTTENQYTIYKGLMYEAIVPSTTKLPTDTTDWKQVTPSVETNGRLIAVVDDYSKVKNIVNGNPIQKYDYYILSKNGLKNRGHYYWDGTAFKYVTLDSKFDKFALTEAQLTAEGITIIGDIPTKADIDSYLIKKSINVNGGFMVYSGKKKSDNSDIKAVYMIYSNVSTLIEQPCVTDITEVTATNLTAMKALQPTITIGDHLVTNNNGTTSIIKSKTTTLKTVDIATI